MGDSDKPRAPHSPTIDRVSAPEKHPRDDEQAQDSTRRQDQYKDRDHRSRHHRDSDRDCDSERSSHRRNRSRNRRHDRDREHRHGKDSSRAHESSSRRSRSPRSHRDRHRERDGKTSGDHESRNDRRRERDRASNEDADRRGRRDANRKSATASDRHGRARQASTDLRDHVKSRRRSRSANGKRQDVSSSPARRSHTALPSQESSWAVTRGEVPPVEKEKPNFGTTGLLAAESNSVRKSDGTMIRLKYTEPPDAFKPRKRESWKLFVFEGKQVLDTIPLDDKAAWLIGRESAVCDFHVDHGSVSGQHVVFQFRLKEKRNEFGDREEAVKLYVIDLESSHGTKLNGETIPTSCYVEVRSGDVVKLGKCGKEYVAMMS
ncbi:uncharacterized protein BROUX77_003945 [Berkeleyomyces rouxiae]|uniref:uncharacterized protein n=1 Tax=Berkeleyomyces rouxiae TaxID=2035830 RepID=UPI003B7FA5FB